jgi:hypothetical protein
LLTHSFAPRSNFGVKVVMAGVLYKNKVVLSSAINGNVKAGGAVGGDVLVRLAIFVIREWVRSVTASALSGDAIFLGDDCRLPVVVVAVLACGVIRGMTVYPSVCKVKSYARCIAMPDISAAHAITWNSLSDGCGIDIVVVGKVELDQRFDDTCGLASFCDL